MPLADSPSTVPRIAYSVFTDTPAGLGPLLLCAEAHGLVAVQFSRAPTDGGDLADFAIEPTPTWQRDDVHPVIRRASHELCEYFTGQRRVFSVPRAPHGTPFQQRVWDQLVQIPYGTTATYQQVAGRIGQPTASRAVGLANGKNPLAIVVPCHRVIGKSGGLTGYAGGLSRKRVLLELEQRVAGSALSFAWL